ncbi:type IX secretion system sortase PorU [Flavobacterium crassostreae]|uniref:Peptidase C25 n=1 Tax=Flavobacterium crassostreae TaxID=1763534 RepID=A0A1B9DXE3_9FLAO|nr:type IX secretion system sortase PorU [Flavobacterium crassostreae]OCB74363.1 peptidase C25 [Flavobacterium crassostreae]
MRKLLLLFTLLICFISQAQSPIHVQINWLENNKTPSGASSFTVPYFSGKAYYYDSDQKKVFFTTNLISSYPLTTNGVVLTNVVYESLPASALGDLSVANLPSEVLPIVSNTTSRGQSHSFLSISPIIKREGSFQRITSFTYSVISNNPAYSKSNNFTDRSQSGIRNSVLANQDWYRFYVEKSGVYKISKSFLQGLGMDLNATDPKRIKIFGNGGRMLPLTNGISYPNDLAENAIQVVGEADGVFDAEDYILFYAEGVDTWNEESQTSINLYSNRSYYYVTTSGDPGKRIAEMVLPTEASTLEITSFDDYQFYEEDKTNIGHLGRQWFGAAFDINKEQEFSFNFPNLDPTIPVKIKLVVASAAYTFTDFQISANGTDLGGFPFPPLIYGSQTVFYSRSLPNNTSFLGAETTKVKIKYNNNGVPGSKGYLDYIQLVARRKLQGVGKQFQFQYDLARGSLETAQYTIGNARQISQVWDVTDIYNVQKVINLNQDVFSFKANLGAVKKYIALDNSDFYTPMKDGRSRVVNQNIKGTIFKNQQGSFEDIDYLIVTPAALVSPAEKLADFHRKNSNLNVKVLALENIYQEFSSGKQDIAAIRNCIKYIYDNGSSLGKKIKYVNLFGDASYDYKDRILNNNNIVPIYHALNSNSSGENSFASDDFYGLMDASEGNIINNFGGIDIAVGRMLVSSVAQAEAMVNKVIEYHQKESYGNWRNNLVIISDDSDNTTDSNLQTRQNTLADLITSKKPFFNVDKIFLDAYTQEASAGGFRYPKARKDLFDAFEKGALVFNYLGHGGEDGLASERIWEKSDGQTLNNQYKYPLFVTITCEFSRFDNPLRPTAGEYTYWNPKGGAIAMITTVRSIGQYNAENFNDVLTEKLFGYNDATEYSIAETLRIAKNSTPNSSTNVVFYIGDPALKLAIAKPKIRLTKVNDVPVDQPTEIFKSLAKIKITGEVTDQNGILLNNYNGVLSATIFDKIIKRTTLNNDGTTTPIEFKTLGETIFRGNASVKNGSFEFGLVVPRDIKIPVDTGKISFYAKKQETLQDTAGFDLSIKIGGVNENAPQDNNNPKVKLYMNDETFVSGGVTNSSPFIVAYLEDENGINTASGIGHDIVAVLDGDVSNPYILNDYYQTNLDDYTKGSLRFPLRDLAPGLHTLSFKAWDVYNNPVVVEIQFVVVGEDTISLTHVLNYPNPFVNYTEFWFTHNRPYEPLNVQIQVMTITGKVVWTKNQIITTQGFLSKEITWDGRDDFGNKMGKGVYVYRLTVKSSLTNKKAEKIEKLVLL